MTANNDDYSQYDDAPVEGDALAELSRLADEARIKEEVVEDLEHRLKMAKQSHARLVEETLPAQMSKLGLTEFKTTSGFKIKIKELVFASIPKEQLPGALAWLEANGHGGLIKNEFTVPFKKGETERAERLAAFLTEEGDAHKRKEYVHSQTLKAFVKEMLEEGEELPDDLFTVHRKQVAKID